MEEKQSGKLKTKKAKVFDFILKYCVITLGGLSYSLGVALFLDANNFASGGVTGISIIISYVIEQTTGFDLSSGIIILILNVPLFILGAIYFGKKFALSTVYSTVISSALIWLWTFLLKDSLPFTDNLLLSALVGGALFGLGLGIIFRMGSSTGGTDIVVKILRTKFRYIPTGMISLSVDLTIVLTSALVYWTFGMQDFFEITCYTTISIVVFTLMFDWVLYGGNSAKLVYIISDNDKANTVCDRILKELDIGATYVDGKGAFTGNDKRIILCAVKRLYFPKLRDIVKAVDPNAFLIVTSAKEIYGEGYKDHFDDEI